MALTVFEPATEQRLPCHVDQRVDGGKPAADLAVLLQETDHGGEQQRPARDDVWSMIQSQRPAAPRQAQYVPARRASSLLSQKSLEVCTETLGSETGSDGFSDPDAATDRSCPDSGDDAEEEVAAPAPPPRAFPPPLPSLARRAVGAAVQMRQHRRDGRLVVEAVPVPSPNLLRAQRRGGRLLLSFADTAASIPDDGQEPDDDEGQAREEEEEDDDGEEVEVVDRGTIVEVKVSTPQLPRNGGGNGARVHRSSLVINKFVGAEPVAACEIDDAAAPAPKYPPKPPRRPTGSTATVAAASALNATAPPPPECDGACARPGEGKLVMTTKRRHSKQELLNHMRCCGQLSGKLFIWEPRVATSS